MKRLTNTRNPRRRRRTLAHLTPLFLCIRSSTHNVNARAEDRHIYSSSPKSLQHVDIFNPRAYDPDDVEGTCYKPLYDADADGDGIVQNSEYVSFIYDLSDGYFDVDTYPELPFILKVNFIYVSCLCNSVGGENGCCQGPDSGIYTNGTGPGETPTEDEVAYLETVCSDTQEAVEFAIEEIEGISPSMMPSGVLSLDPSFSPSVGPSFFPSFVTDSPTEEPTESPTKQPTDIPTTTPTATPSVSPTKSPTSQPTSSPTVSPTKTPSREPTSNPTAPPNSPTSGPTKSPSFKPTLSPIIVPSMSPTESSENPSSMPTLVSSEVTGSPTFTSSSSPSEATKDPSSAVTPSPNESTVSPAGLPTFAPTITSVPTIISSDVPTLPPGSTKSPAVSNIPTTSTLVPTTPPGVTKSPSVPSVSTPVPTSPPGVTKTPSLSPLTPVESPPPTGSLAPSPGANVPGVTEPGGGIITDSDGITPGAIAGITLASVFVVYVGLYLIASRRERRDSDPQFGGSKRSDEELGGSHGSVTSSHSLYRRKSSNAASSSASSLPPRRTADNNDSPPPPAQSASHAAVGGASNTLAASSSVGAPTKSTLAKFDVESPPQNLINNAPPDMENASASDSGSSHTGSSGWSTSDGLSSLNTSSFDASMTDSALMPVSMLAAIGVASSVTERVGTSRSDVKPVFVPVSDTNDDESGSISSASAGIIAATNATGGANDPYGKSDKVTREDLDAAIEAGDWAAVGATAALLANSSDVSSVGSGKGGSVSSRESSNVSSEQHDRAAELDRLVEAGDWEGVVQAATRYEGASDTTSRAESKLSSSEDDISSKTGNSVSFSSSRKTRDKSDIRAEVETLVRRVVPDEIDNVDEMMLQFSGREEELVETLRTMQERSIAQRARIAVQKSAKLEARSKAQLSVGSVSSHSSATGSIGSRGITPFGRRSSNSTGPKHYGSEDDDSASDMSDLGMGSIGGSFRGKGGNTSLEIAIEKGDWHAVSEAAALMGDNDQRVTSTSKSVESNSSRSSSSAISSSRGNRVLHLDSLIDKGDWSGIVAAAGQYQAMDERQAAKGSQKNNPRPAPATLEEKEALAQADMWQTIANQSKQERSSASKGASEAADWAISRSLSLMRKNNENTGSGGKTAKKPRIIDDESV